MKEIQHEVMKRIRRIYVARTLVLPTVFLATSVAVLVSTVSISNVILNMLSVGDIQSVIGFFVSAFAHTQVVVQCALVAGMVFLVLTLRGVVISAQALMAFKEA